MCVGFTDDDILSLGCDRNDDEWDDDDDDGEKHLLRLTTKALLLSMMMRLLSLWNAATRLESPRERLLSITPFVKKGEKCPKNISAQIIDDTKKITLLSASSIEKDLKVGDKINKT